MDNLVSLQSLFDGSVFKIPNYQRGYSWDSEQRNDLIDDLESISNNKKHYTGTIVIKEKDEIKGTGETFTRYEVVDGQQRLTTLIILLNSVVNQIESPHTQEVDQIANTVRDRYIRRKGSQAYIYKLELDELNDQFFKEAVIEGKTDIEKKTKSHQRLSSARNEFNTYLTNKKKQTATAYPDFLNGLIDKITQSLLASIDNLYLLAS